MNDQQQAAVIANDLDSLRHRIEGLPAHARYTDALNLVAQARDAIKEGAADLHQQDMRKRFAELDARK